MRCGYKELEKRQTSRRYFNYTLRDLSDASRLLCIQH